MVGPMGRIQWLWRRWYHGPCAVSPLSTYTWMLKKFLPQEIISLRNISFDDGYIQEDDTVSSHSLSNIYKYPISTIPFHKRWYVLAILTTLMTIMFKKMILYLRITYQLSTNMQCQQIPPTRKGNSSKYWFWLRLLYVVDDDISSSDSQKTNLH